MHGSHFNALRVKLLTRPISFGQVLILFVSQRDHPTMDFRAKKIRSDGVQCEADLGCRSRDASMPSDLDIEGL